MSKFICNVNGIPTTFDETYHVPDDVRRYMIDNGVTTNGCGTGILNKIPISFLEWYAGVDLFMCCVIHDVCYELCEPTLMCKSEADHILHRNILAHCANIGVSLKKTRFIARWFRIAVFYAKDSSIHISTTL